MVENKNKFGSLKNILYICSPIRIEQLVILKIIGQINMKSKIQIDFDGVQPCLTIDRVNSEDVRDKLLIQFFHNIGYESNKLVVTFGPSDIEGNCRIRLYPENKTHLIESNEK